MLYTDKNAFILKEKIKELGGKWDKEAKKWNVPMTAVTDLKKMSQKVDDDKTKIWIKACEFLNFKFVKKGTGEYDQVLQVYKDLINDYKFAL